ncbi:hypothetical protein MUN82_09995 [Hymenobacter aerilatus]|uniref:DNA binding HTH domain-containing protein n=1 Tax=Hymenobacter aerilatus TaxID=2932251 RepID=A0A8T9T461_9BACT|nr:helix-turn-helix domain-containing protein [Hymenobacter aerilatus]UOR07410.1 hypothetical protein MUN82_09995 [Hymenobacter aerilatus]
MQNTIEGLYMLHAESEIELHHLPRRLREPAAGTLSLRLLDAERVHILHVLKLKKGVKLQAAMALDIDERTLAAKLRGYESDATTNA